jgi:hypothetical protein
MNLTIIRCLALVVSGILPGCSTSGSHSLEPSHVNAMNAGKGVVVLPGSAPANKSFDIAFLQLESAPIALMARQPVTSIKSALKILPDVQKVAVRPIVAVTEYKGWFWYGMDAYYDKGKYQFITYSENPEAGKIVGFIDGYAVKKGHRNVLYWSTW